MDKKTLTSTIIAVTTLVLLVFSATYAYFTVTSDNRFGTKDITAEIEDMADNVVLTQVNNNLSLDISRIQMSEANAGTHYYATGSMKPANIAMASVEGEGNYECDYTIKVTKSSKTPESDMYTAFQGMSTKSTNQIRLFIDNYAHDFYFINSFPITYNGTIKRITADTPQYITSNIVIMNQNINQNALKGTDITLTYEVTNFSCKLKEEIVDAPIFAIFSEDDISLRFYQNFDEVNVGDEYNGYTVTNLYTGIKENYPTTYSDVPWYDDLVGDYLYGYWVYIEDIISPISTAYWFSGAFDSSYIDVRNLNTSNVTNMSYMFDGAGMQTGINYLDLSNFDTSNVTNMSYMFQTTGSENSDFYINVSGWDTSNVTNMEGMFRYTATFTEEDTYYDIFIEGIEDWDVSKVTNMSKMFENTGLYFDYKLDLSKWQVPLVTNKTDFNKNVSSKVIAPTWVN